MLFQRDPASLIGMHPSLSIFKDDQRGARYVGLSKPAPSGNSTNFQQLFHCRVASAVWVARALDCEARKQGQHRYQSVMAQSVMAHRIELQLPAVHGEAAKCNSEVRTVWFRSLHLSGQTAHAASHLEPVSEVLLQHG